MRAGRRPRYLEPQVILPAITRNHALVVAPGILELFGHAIGAAAMVGLWMPALLNVSFMTLPIWLIAFGVALAPW